MDDGELLASLDFVPSCDWPACETRGMWVATWPCCGTVALVCAVHHDEWVAQLKAQRIPHKRCSRIVGHMRWEPLKKGGA